MRGTEDFVLVLFQGFDPGTHVCGMIRGIVGDADFCGDEDACQFSAKLLLGVVQIAESIRLVQRRAIQPRCMAGPVREFVEGRAVVAGRVLEGILRRQVDAVR